MNKKLIFIAIGVFIFGVMLWRLMSTAAENKRLREQKVAVAFPSVETALPQKLETSDYIESWGEAQAVSSVTLYSTLSGKLAGLSIDVGSTVAVGQQLGLLDRNLQPLEFKETAITATAAGTVTKKMVEIGATITPQTPLCVVQDLSTLIVNVPVPLQQISRVRTGMPAEISCDAVPGSELKGSVSKIAPTSSEQSRATNVEVRLSDHRIKPGMYLRVKLKDRTSERIFIPARGVDERGGKSLAVVLRAPVVHKIPVMIGQCKGDLIEIINGINMQDTVISSSGEFLADGDTVIISGLKP